MNIFREGENFPTTGEILTGTDYSFLTRKKFLIRFWQKGYLENLPIPFWSRQEIGPENSVWFIQNIPMRGQGSLPSARISARKRMEKKMSENMHFIRKEESISVIWRSHTKNCHRAMRTVMGKSDSAPVIQKMMQPYPVLIPVSHCRMWWSGRLKEIRRNWWSVSLMIMQNVSWNMVENTCLHQPKISEKCLERFILQRKLKRWIYAISIWYLPIFWFLQAVRWK